MEGEWFHISMEQLTLHQAHLHETNQLGEVLVSKMEQLLQFTLFWRKFGFLKMSPGGSNAKIA